MGDPHTYLPALLSRPGSVHLAAWDDADRIIAVGHLMPDRSDAEAALLVEDEWQNRGLGSRLLQHLGEYALGGLWKTVYGLVLRDDKRIAAILSHTTVPVYCSEESGTTTAWAHTYDLATDPHLRHRSVLRTGR
ncbi:GNAT family N-acetyltransferase [Streptomyces sp. NPDC127036]|uniref:GNAT family N-acetyltransferase n=1 Tax=Streptomyces sp. NPDC127036 TaxID=3347112 RepID=UPI003660577C